MVKCVAQVLVLKETIIIVLFRSFMLCSSADKYGLFDFG